MNRLERWESDNIPWSRHKIIYGGTVRERKLLYKDLEQWSKESLTGKFVITIGIAYFEFEDDAVLFGLRWL